MIDLGNAYFCCDECPICEGLEHRLRNAEMYGEFQYDYCGCDKTVESKILYAKYPGELEDKLFTMETCPECIKRIREFIDTIKENEND
jgi:hypothetical protein